MGLKQIHMKNSDIGNRNPKFRRSEMGKTKLKCESMRL